MKWLGYAPGSLPINLIRALPTVLIPVGGACRRDRDRSMGRAESISHRRVRVGFRHSISYSLRQKKSGGRDPRIAVELRSNRRANRTHEKSRECTAEP